MAEIKMDVTEYDSLRKNVALAEQRANDLKEANTKIEELQKEKIDALKAAEKQVIYRRESRSEEVVRPIRSRSEILRHLESRFGSSRSSSYSSGLDRYPYSRLGGAELYGGYDPYGVADLADMFFSKDIIRATPTVESVTTKGLDEVKAELREQLEAKLSEEVKTKLVRLEKIEPQVKELKAEVATLEKKVTITGDHYTDASNKVLELQEKLKKAEKVLIIKIDALNSIRTIINSKISRWFGASKSLTEISNYVGALDKEMKELNGKDR